MKETHKDIEVTLPSPSQVTPSHPEPQQSVPVQEGSPSPPLLKVSFISKSSWQSAEELSCK
jgi:hypothetical protein